MSRPDTLAQARVIAHKVLVRVAQDGAWAEQAMNAQLSRRPLQPRDRALCTRLVYGTLRQQIHIDFVLQHFIERGFETLPADVKMALRMGVYQILETRIPPHSIVNDSVTLARRRHPKLAGLCNAVLRRVIKAQEADDLPMPKSDDVLADKAVLGSLPEYVVREAAALLPSMAELDDFIAATNEIPPLCLRVNRLRTSRTALVATLEEAGHRPHVVQRFPDGISLDAAGQVDQLPGFDEGLFTIQDFGAQLVGHLLEPGPTDTVLDACAAPGGKSTHLAELMGDKGQIVAAEVHRGKTRLIAANAERLGLRSIAPLVVDAGNREELEDAFFQAKFEAIDHVVLDAPCTGSGTLRRNPEARTKPSAVAALHAMVETQRRLLASTQACVPKGGRLVYVVCSFMRAEGEEQVDWFLENHPEFRLRPISSMGSAEVLLPFATPYGDEPKAVFRTWTHRHGCDGFFGACFERC